MNKRPLIAALIAMLVAIVLLVGFAIALNANKDTTQEKACVAAGKQWTAVNHHWWALTNNHECLGVTDGQ